MQIMLLTDGSNDRQLVMLLEESGLEYETQFNNIRHDLPILIVNDKELNFTKAQRWIKRKVREHGETLYD